MSKFLKFVLPFIATYGGNLLAQSQALTTNNSLNLPGVAVNIGSNGNLVNTVELITIFTILTLAPAFIILCTSFTRIIIVLSFTRQAIGTQNLPPNQLLIGFALFLSIFVMAPTGKVIYQDAITPYLAKKIDAMDAIKLMEKPMRTFMTKYIRTNDLSLFYDVTGDPRPDKIDDVPIHYLIPAFIISELKTSFQIGFLLYVPFLVLDMVVAAVLMAMGMMMLPPVVISFPFKLLLFVMVDGWQLITGSLLRSFG